MGQKMILPDFILSRKVNQSWQYTGMDSLELCLDKKHFLSYPYNITYNYNSRGFRDAEWPNTVEELKNAVWCVGDSFTVGVGSPVEHTWPYMLQQNMNMRTINVSMDGASNNWIARKVVKILTEIVPKTVIIHWSYIARREIDLDIALDELWKKFYNDICDPSWPVCSRQDIDKLPQKIIDEINSLHGGLGMTVPSSDEDRRVGSVACSDQDDIENTLNCINLVDRSNTNTQIVHSFIPKFVPRKLRGVIESQILGSVISEIQILDLARDGHHYDIKTAQSFVRQIMQQLK
jgi:hypothetical protein